MTNKQNYLSRWPVAALVIAAGSAVTNVHGAVIPSPFPPEGEVAYGVTQNNDLYTYNLNTHALTYKQAITGLQPGETIRGIDMKEFYWPDTEPSLDAYLLGSSGRVYYLDYNAGSGSWTTSVIMPTWSFAVTGDSVGFEANSAWLWGSAGPCFYASSGNGPLFAHKPAPAGHYEDVTSMAHYADGSPAHIGGLASHIDSGFSAPPWGVYGIEVTNHELVIVDPHHPANGYGGPTLGLVTPVSDITGEAGALDLSSLVGFDMQELWKDDAQYLRDRYVLLALNESGNPYTSIYSAGWLGSVPSDPLVFTKIGDMVLDERAPVKFTAVAMIPSGGPAMLGAVAVGMVLRRRRR